MISVIVPVYNGEAHLEDCLRSILGQTDSNLEILLIDDGSTDETPEICRRLAETDGRIRLFRQENAGVSSARNHGLAEAKGRYLTFVDADDLLPPTALADLRREMETGVDLVIGSHTCFRGRWEKQIIRTPSEDLDAHMSLMCGKLYRRSLVEAGKLRFRENLPYGEDTVFNLQYHKSAPKKAVLSRVVYRCRMGGMASSVRYYPHRDKIALTLIDAYCAFFGGADLVPPAVLERIVRNELTEMTLHYLVHQNIREARTRLEGIAPCLPGSCETEEIAAILRRHWLRILLRKLKKRIKG